MNTRCTSRPLEITGKFPANKEATERDTVSHNSNRAMSSSQSETNSGAKSELCLGSVPFFGGRITTIGVQYCTFLGKTISN